MSVSEAADVVDQIRGEVARRRAAGEYPLDLLARLELAFDPMPAAAPLEALAHLETVRPLESERGGRVGRGVVFAKRAVRRAIAWYVRPIVQDQTRFNFAVVRRLYELEERVVALEARHETSAVPPSDVRPTAPPSA